MDITDKAFNRIKQDLDKVSEELMELIKAYHLDVTSPLDIISTAQEKITEPQDYIRFLELSLQGRLLGESIVHIMQAKQNNEMMH